MKEQRDPKKPKSKPYKNYAVYSGIAFQMFAVIGVGAFIGVRLDRYFETQKPWFTTVTTLFAVFASIYLTIKQITSQTKKDKD
ncbi:MAG TPA: AtpZ/AtpI family protein [Flavobacteriaceae bacterium]|nr:AtpZ/AtpI family protein [Flavobacteriaceae bacterium]